MEFSSTGSPPSATEPSLEEIDHAIQYGPVPILSTEITDRPDLLHMCSPELAFPEVNVVWRFRMQGDPENAIDRIVRKHRRQKLPLWWLLSPSTLPSATETLLIERGLRFEFDALGLAIDTDTIFPTDSGVTIEKINAGNFARYWEVFSKPVVAANSEWMLETLAGRFGRVEIFVANVDQEPVGAGAIRIFPNGTAYLLSGFTKEPFRHRGIYRALLAHRLRFLREAGVRWAITLAKVETSAPICLKMGFREYGRYRMMALRTTPVN